MCPWEVKNLPRVSSSTSHAKLPTNSVLPENGRELYTRVPEEVGHKKLNLGAG